MTELENSNLVITKRSGKKFKHETHHYIYLGRLHKPSGVFHHLCLCLTGGSKHDENFPRLCEFDSLQEVKWILPVS